MSVSPPNSRRRTTQWNLFFNYIYIGLSLVSGVLLVPLYLKHIPLDLYGLWLATGNILAWLMVVDPGISGVLQQRVADAKGRNSNAQIGEWIGAGFMVTSAVGLVLLTVGITMAPFVMGWLGLSGGPHHTVLVSAFLWSVVGGVLMLLSYSVSAVNLGLQGSLGLGIIFTAVTAASILLTLGLLLAGQGIMAIAMASVFRGGGLLVGHLLYMRSRLKSENIVISWSFDAILPLLRLISFTSAVRLAGVVVSQMDLFIVARILGPESAAILALTRKAPETSRLLIERPSLALMPALAHATGAGDHVQASRAITQLFRAQVWGAGLLVAVFFTLNQAFVALWVGPTLFAGQHINLAVCAGTALAGTLTTISNVLFARGSIRSASVMTIVQMFFYVVLLAAGGSKFGLLGVAVAGGLSALAALAAMLPGIVRSQLQLSREECGKLVKQVAITIGAAAIAVGLGRTCMIRCSWLYLALSAAAVAGIYLTGLAVMSRDFRSDLVALARTLRPQRRVTTR